MDGSKMHIIHFLDYVCRVQIITGDLFSCVEEKASTDTEYVVHYQRRTHDDDSHR